MRKSVLWMVPKWLLPPHDGSRLAAVQLIRSVAAKARVDLLALAANDEAVDVFQARRELGVENVFVVRRPGPNGRARALRLALRAARRPALPMTAAAFALPEVTDAIARRLKGRRWDWLIFESMHGAAAFSAGGRFVRPAFARAVAYRAQNVERDLWTRAVAAERSPWKKTFLWWQGEMVRRLEDSLVVGSDLVLAITDEDARAFRSYCPGARVLTVPVAMKFPAKPPRRRRARGARFLYCGRLDWAPNRQGLEWLLREVWPEVARSRDTSLTIVGNGNAEWLERYRHLPGIDPVGYVESTEPYFAGASALLVPVFVGSGVRMKMIEASINGLVCVSTRLGALGTGLLPEHHYLPADTREEWIAQLSGFDPVRGQAKGVASFHHLKAAANARRTDETFLHLI